MWRRVITPRCTSSARQRRNKMTKLALPQDVKKRQMVILVGAGGGLILIVLFGLWMSDPNRGKPDPRDVAKREAEQVEKQYDIGQDAITAEESWIARSE